MSYKPMSDEELTTASWYNDHPTDWEAGIQRMEEQCRRANKLAEAVVQYLHASINSEEFLQQMLAAYRGEEGVK